MKFKYELGDVVKFKYKETMSSGHTYKIGIITELITKIDKEDPVYLITNGGNIPEYDILSKLMEESK